ncbi:MAG: NAD(P)/FAD-dependent oxidoreductase [Candidatus Eiseniibacteriota bacterium]
MNEHYTHVIIGGGLAGASAIEGIRAHDRDGSILLISRENVEPYHRPPLSKDLWFGKSTLEKLPVYDAKFYEQHRVEIALRREVVELEASSHTLWDDHGGTLTYDKLLLATGGKPRLLDAEGESGQNVHYYRLLEDYLFLSERVARIQHVLVVGGGFIGLELAAALRHAGKEVSLVYPGEYPLARVLPRELGLYVADFYREKGVETISGETVVAIHEGGGIVQARTRSGNTISTQLVVAGVGISPLVGLAEANGLEVADGIVVDEYARTSDANIFAAGDVAEFPYLALGRRMRVEHWDHAIQHGKLAGENMAGANRMYDHLPMFFSDFFEIGWEAVGDTDPALQVEEEWTVPNREGVLFYLQDDLVRGVLLWNRFGLLDWARDLIRSGRPMTRDERLAAMPVAQN